MVGYMNGYMDGWISGRMERNEEKRKGDRQIDVQQAGKKEERKEEGKKEGTLNVFNLHASCFKSSPLERQGRLPAPCLVSAPLPHSPHAVKLAEPSPQKGNSTL